MKGSIAITAASAALASAVGTPTKIEARQSGASSGSVPTVTVKGNAFFAGDERFYIRGVDYQPGGASDAKDPIADVQGCKRDVEEFKKLGLNTIRVYTVDNTADHDECMSMLADAGIYLALDVNTPLYSINRGSPGASYNPTYLQSIFATIDAFANYDNTLLFFSGNEVINDDQTTDCAPFVKSTTRDMKQYIGSRGYRKIPVGYSAADVEESRYEMAQYMNCGTEDQRSDFFAFNDYAWCDPSSFEQSGWNQKVEMFSNYSIPIFLSEYGCIKNERKFEEVASLYSDDMTSVYSGGLVYEYSEETNGYGLVKINGDSVTENSDFQALMEAFKNTASPSGDGGYSDSNKPADCPGKSDTFELGSYSGEALPAMPAKAQEFMRKGAGEGPGLDGEGSQNAGGGSTETASAGSGEVTMTATNSGATAAQTSNSNSDSDSDSDSDSGSSAAEVNESAAAPVVGAVGFAPLICSAVVLVGTFLGATFL